MLYSLLYRRLGEQIRESFEDLEDALVRSSEILTSRWGVPQCIDCDRGVLFDQEALFTDWCKTHVA